MVIEDGWAEANLTSVLVPQLNRRVTIHVKAEAALVALFAEWARLGLLGRVLTWNGSWVPRFKRQAGTAAERATKCRLLGAQALSNHAWGTAFDVNAKWNGLGRAPAPAGTTGSVVELVAAAEMLGWFWGGRFRTRPDGMHFEYVGAAAPSERMAAGTKPPAPPATPTAAK